MSDESKTISVIIPCNTHWLPFINKYIAWLKEFNAAYDIILWDRDQSPEIFDAPSYIFHMNDTTDNHNAFKLYKFIAFAAYVRKTIIKNKSKKIIFMGTYAALPVILSGYLKKHFPFSYWIDVRDSTYERFSFYKKLLKKAVDNSYATAISSPGFLEFLPESDYLYVHNVDPERLNKSPVGGFEVRGVSIPIRISFIGNVRYYDINAKLIEALGNDKRFILQYFGAGSETLQQYCSDKGVTNVLFKGRFDYSETEGLYQSTDIINNLYGNESVEVRTALSNKLYYASMFSRPILVSRDTYMADVVLKYKLGIDIDINSVSLADDIYKWYQTYHFDEESNTQFTEWVLSDEEKAKQRFISFIKAV